MVARIAKVVHQSAAAECGLACAAMILQAHGIGVQLQQIRQTHDVSLRGSSLRDLLTLIEDYGLAARPMRVEIDRLKQVTMPCILHWSFDHFIVLERCRGSSFDIIDPACGRRRVSRAEVDDKFTGIALEVIRPIVPVTLPNPDTKLRLIHLLPPFNAIMPLLAMVLMITLMLNAGALLLPLLVKVLLDRIGPGTVHPLFWGITSAFLALAVLQGVNKWARGIGLSRLRRFLSYHMAQSVFGHLIWLNASVIERRSAGTIASNFRSIFALSDTLGEDVLSAVIDSVATIAVIGVLLWYDAVIGCIVFAAVTSYGLWTIAGNRGAKIRMGQVLAHESREGGFFVETINRLQAIRLFQVERWRTASFATIHERLEDARDDYAQWLNGSRAVGEALLQICWVTVVAIAAWRVSTGGISVGLFSSIIVWLGLATTRARDAVTRVAQLDWLESHVDRLADILLSPSDRDDSDACMPSPPVESIGCEGLSARYGPSLPRILNDVNLEVSRGEWITIVGSSGQGKSTLVKTLTGLMIPEEGTLRLDGESTPWQSTKRLRRSVGAVMQNDGLLAGSIRDNITFFDEHANVELMESCAALAEISDDIARMPMKYDSLVGEQGAGLSAGQGQRLMLARALYKKPSFLILDEFTSNIDEESEARIIANIKKIGMGVIAIAHRSHVINAADRIYELHEGRLTVRIEPSLCHSSL